jgi:hypothetical protein
MLVNSSVAAQLADFQEGLSYMELFISLGIHLFL